MKQEFIEKIYAGWLAKIIGIRLGAPIEGWTYQKIKDVYGEILDYPVDYSDFAADDDSNGPIFFLRALEDCKNELNMEAQDVAEALLNYAPFEHGFFWWGGYGVSTEHTAYLNLRNGIKAPASGSIAQNGYATAEQIGGQIFIDTWGLVAPGNPDLAAKYAAKAASVTHDGNGIYGGIFVATCISFAFIEKDMIKIIEKALSYIPQDCEYTRMVKAVMAYYKKYPENWRNCFQYIYENFGYDKYPGHCHIIPNSAVMILSMLYGKNDFSNTINICNMCGWDTDCNVGNVATIMGVLVGLEGIDYNKWRKPINDFLACSSVIGSLNIMDIPYGAAYITKLAYAVAKEELPENWKTIIENRIDACHFEFEGSTHAIRVRARNTNDFAFQQIEYNIINTDETAATGNRSLKVMAKPVNPADAIYVYKKTYYSSKDFNDSRYDPCFSPVAYPGQTVHGSAYIPEYGIDAKVCLYARDKNSGEEYFGKLVTLSKGQWANLEFNIPVLDGALIEEVGFCFYALGVHGDFNNRAMTMMMLVDDLYVDGIPSYSIDFAKEEEDVWHGMHREISQFTKLKGLMYMENGEMHLSCSDFAEAYTGKYDWKDYTAKFYMTPITGEHNMVNARVQGALRSYAAGLLPDGKFGILKNNNGCGYKILASADFRWTHNKEYLLEIKVEGNSIKASVDNQVMLEYLDEDYPFMTGSIGVSMEKGCHSKYTKICVEKIT